MKSNPKTLTTDQQKKATSMQYLIGKFTQYEREAYYNGVAIERLSQHHIFFSGDAFVDLDCNMNHTRYLYRCMSEDEFKAFCGSNKLSPVDDKGYGGMANNRNYAKKYLTNEGGSHVLEFILPVNMPVSSLMDLAYNSLDEAKKLESSVKKKASHVNRQQPKLENGGVSIGLGPSGQYEGHIGKIVNEMLANRTIEWRVVDFRMKRPGGFEW